MKTLGALFRAIFNINFIWGAMILISFGLCVLQHYLPTTTTLGPGVLREGDNVITITLGSDGQATSEYSYPLRVQSGAVTIAPGDRRPPSDAPDRPWLLEARRSGTGYLLRWDCSGHGPYSISVNGNLVRKGSLVRLQTLTDAAFDWAQVGFDISLGLVAAMVLFLGLMKVGENAGVVQLVARLFHPVIRFLFPEIPKDHPAAGAILMNVTSTVLGLGNAATPFGLKAMQHLQTLNPEREVATNAQVMLLAINTAGFALIPTTLLALRKSKGCADPFEVIGTCMVAGATATIVAITVAKLLGRLPVFSTRAAVTDAPAADAATADEEKGE